MNTEILRVVVEGVDKNLSMVAKQVKGSLDSLKTSFLAFNNVMKTSNTDLNRMGVAMGINTNMGAKFALTLKQVSSQLTMGMSYMRKYRMEILGVLFFSMYLQNVFKGWLQPAAQAFGMFELFSTMLLVLFLPVIEKVFPIFLEFINFMMDLPEPIKLAIGWFAIIGLVISSIVLWLAKLAIGIGVLADIKAISKLVGAVRWLFGVIKVAAVKIGWVLIPIIAIVIGIIDIFRNWGESTRKVVRGILTVIAGVAGVVAVVLGAPALLVAAIVAAVVGIIYTIIKYWDEIVDLFSKGWDLVKKTTSSAWDWIKNIFDKTWKWIKDTFTKIKETTRESWDWIWFYISGVVSIILDWVKDKFKAITDFIKNIFSTDLSTNLTKIWNSVKTGFKELVDGAYNWAVDMANNFIKGIKSMFAPISNAIKNTFSRTPTPTPDPTPPPTSSGSGSSSGGGFSSPFTQWGNVAQNPSTGKWEVVKDFILQPGGRLIKTDPNDTIVGTKNGGMQGITINQTNNVSGTLMSDINRAINDNNKRLVDDIKRLSGA